MSNESKKAFSSENNEISNWVEKAHAFDESIDTSTIERRKITKRLKSDYPEVYIAYKTDQAKNDASRKKVRKDADDKAKADLLDALAKIKK